MSDIFKNNCRLKNLILFDNNESIDKMPYQYDNNYYYQIHILIYVDKKDVNKDIYFLQYKNVLKFNVNLIDYNYIFFECENNIKISFISSNTQNLSKR